MNSEIQDDTELGKMMHDFHCTSADQFYNRKLSIEEIANAVGLSVEEVTELAETKTA